MPVTPDEMVAAVEKHGSIAVAARECGVSWQTVSRAWAKTGRPKPLEKGQTHKPGERAATAAPIVPLAEPLPDPDMPIADVLAWRRQAFERKAAHHAAKRWRRFTVPASGPYALMFFGDPHVDDDGCNLPLLESHAALARDTEALFAVNIGDTTNNWVGRLARLWANQDASAKTAKQLAKWLLSESGIPWFLWLHGNHDLWDGPVGTDWFGAIKPAFVCMEDWQAKVTLAGSNGHELRLWAAHNFKGNSIWNNMHGLERAAQMQDWAHLYVAGHHHDTGLRHGENPHRNFCYWLMRVRGYKWMDEYAELHGFGEHQFGAAAIAVIDPAADKPNAVTCFLDPFEGAEFLAFKRRKAAA